MNDWYHDGVHYCLENGLMAGTGATTFAPDADTSRAMIVTILWRLEGSPVVDYLMDYADVPGDAWYAGAVRWATAEGVAGGYGAGRFGPEDAVTREQFAAILYRYEQSKGDGVLETQMFFLDYSDVDQVSEWAVEAMRWWNMNGIMEGIGNDLLNPKGTAARAQTAVVLKRFCDKY